MDLLLLERKGLSQRQIAKKLGISRNTVKKYMENQGYPEERKTIQRKSLLDPFTDNIAFWLNEDLEYTATWIYDRLCNIDFTGSYEIVKRKVHKIKAERQRVAYMRFETEPGFQAQVDFGAFQVENADGSIRTLYLFTMILGYSRKMYGELIDRCDLPTFLDCHINAFDYFGGVADEILYDRMKNVYIGKAAGKKKFNSTLLGFALHYGFKPEVAPAFAAWVKGKVERPYKFIREGFWRGYGFICRATANRDLISWLEKKDERVHGTTHEVVSLRFKRERPHLNLLPPNAFDTSYRIYRKVNKDCIVRFDCNHYVVPHTLVGKELLLRVKDKDMRIFDNDSLIVTYKIPEGKGHLVQDKKFYEALRKDKEMNKRKYAHVKRSKGRAKSTISPSKPLYDMDVEVRSTHIYDAAAGVGT
ncbi:MAG: IS21 family transposase [Candidatus Aminicenantaceae bacterium]